MRSKSAELKTKICDTVNDWKRNVGRTPSLKELGDELGVNKSTISFVSYQINQIVSLFFGLAISDCSKETNCLNIS